MKAIKAIICLFGLIGGFSAHATHLMGGNLSYVYLGKVNGMEKYKMTLKIYRDCSISKGSPVLFDDEIMVGIYNNDAAKSLLRIKNILKIDENPVGMPWNKINCPELPEVCISEGIYSDTIFLPPSTAGYHFYYQRCCRNKQVNTTDDEGQSYYAFIPNTNDKNNSPDFTSIPAPFICVGDTNDYQNTCTDIDGDSLIYSLVHPWAGGNSQEPKPTPPSYLPWPIPSLVYISGYTTAKPFGNNGYVYINPTTGLCKYKASLSGHYAIAIEVKEFRKGVLLSTVRRDIQIIVGNCKTNSPPRLAAGTQTSYTIVEGDKLCFNVKFIDTDTAQKITLTAIGDPLSGSGGVISPLATMSGLIGTGSVSSQFCWQTGCEHGRTQPYFITAEATDDGCPHKTTLINFFITVKPFTSQGNISGDSLVCLDEGAVTYTSPQKTGYIYDWTVNNGSITAGHGSNSITVNWSKSGTGMVVLTEKNPAGCLGSPDTLDVVILPDVPMWLIQGDTDVCEYEKTVSYNITNTAASTYQWFVTNGSIKSGQGTSSITVDWFIKDSGTVSVIETNSNNCKSGLMLQTVWIHKPVTLPIGGTPSVCPNLPGVEYSTAGTSGSQYFWKVTGGTQVAGGTSNIIYVDWGGIGTGEVALLEIDKYGCLGDSLKFAVTKEYKLESQVPEGDTILCAFSQGILYSVHKTNRSMYAWTVTGGSMISGQGSHEIVVNWDGPGQATVTVIETSYDSVTGLPCVSDPHTLNIRIAALPSADLITGPFNLCETTTRYSYSTKGNTGSSFIWALDGTQQLSTLDTVSFVFEKAGLYTISFIEITVDSCIGLIFDSIVTVHPKPTTGPIIGDSFICHPNFLWHIYTVSGFAGSTYLWGAIGGKVMTGQGTTQASIDWLGSNPAKVFVRETSDKGCTGDSIQLQLFIDKPGINLTFATVGIQNDQANELNWELTNAPRYNSPFDIYRRGDTSSSYIVVGTVDSATFKYTDIRAAVNDSSYQYYISGKDLCVQEIYSTPHTTILLKGEKDFTGYNVNLNWSRYKGWQNGVSNYATYRRLADDPDYKIYEAQYDTIAFYTNGFDSYQQYYRIVAGEAKGKYQSWSNKILFSFDPVVWVPNAFSPNEDRLNDVFQLKGGSLKHFEIHIYNRWGERMFESTSLENSWDGNFRDHPCQQDVYVYCVKYWGFDNVLKTKTGNITLLK